MSEANEETPALVENQAELPKAPAQKSFKVVELGPVTDESLEQVLNECCNQGWELHDIRFVLRDASRRPAMAFVIFVRC